MLIVPAYAKINWNLHVLGKRADNFHEICTTFQTVSLCDYLTFSLSDALDLTCNLPGVPVDETNLILRAADVLRENFEIKSGAKIHLQKMIPSPGGLGGGSSNAAITLLALSFLWSIKTTRRELAEIGAKLGADVPFFLFGGTALGTGIGTEIEFIEDVPQTLLLVIAPNEIVPTAMAYKGLNAPVLTMENAESILTICRLGSEEPNFRQTILHNDFEQSVFREKPEIARTKAKLLALGATGALMSGSGASVFGIFDNDKIRQSAAEILRQTEKDWRTFVCETISRHEYAESFGAIWKLPDE